VYRFVRHPIYGGIVLGAAGLSLADGNATAVALTAGLAALFYGKSGYEERRLIARFPEYLAYRARVRCRLLPGIC
jgi:protein-S-isoprenylcysteine O-methyltransferase Ste14